MSPGSFSATVSVRDHGAKGDGFTDDTAAFAASIRALGSLGGGELRVPSSPAPYMIDANAQAGKGIRLGSDTWLHLDAGAALKALPSTLSSYSIVIIADRTNVVVSGGHIIGDRSNHGGRTGEYGIGINVLSSSNVRIHDVTIVDCWGDGILLYASDTAKAKVPCVAVTIDKVICANNRRQGLSIVCASRVLVTNCEFRGTNGTPPSAGIDCEPDDETFLVEDVSIKDCRFFDNEIGVQFSTGSTRCIVSGSTFRGNRQFGVYFGITAGPGCSAAGNAFQQTNTTQIAIYFGFNTGGTATGNTITGTFRYAIWCHSNGTPAAGGRNLVANNHITGDGQGHGIMSSNRSDGNLFQGNIISGVVIGLYASNCDTTRIVGNRVTRASAQGFNIDTHNGVVISDNHASACGNHGFYVANGMRCDINHNVADRNGTYGFLLERLSDSDFVDNTSDSNSQAKDDTYDNVFVGAVSHLRLERNLVRRGVLAKKPRYGINIYSGTNVRLVHNDAAAGGKRKDVQDTGTGTVILSSP
jgi:nitrous oxidase accessory protein NosD